MKGPHERLKYDLRRLWECPRCRRRERTDGSVTFRYCTCEPRANGGLGTPMKLLEEAGHRTVPPIRPGACEEPATVQSPDTGSVPAAASPESAAPPEDPPPGPS